MATIEKRYIRIEDWKGNIYYPETSGGSTTAGVTMDAKDASTDPESGAATYTEGAIVTDNTANNATAIMLSGTSTKVLYATETEVIPFGNTRVNIRAKSSKVTDIDILEAKMYYVDNMASSHDEVLVYSTYIKGTSFGTANVYKNISFDFNYTGVNNGSTSLVIKIYYCGDSDSVVYFDDVSISKIM